MLEPCDLIIEPGAGARIQETFANARYIADVTTHTVLVRGNDVEVAVTPRMDDNDCHLAYDTALHVRDAALAATRATKAATTAATTADASVEG